jgi:hypothetical protein
MPIKSFKLHAIRLEAEVHFNTEARILIQTSFRLKSLIKGAIISRTRKEFSGSSRRQFGNNCSELSVEAIKVKRTT